MSLNILEYRNGIYQGYVKANKRNGMGILITDDGQILIGDWKNDLLDGKALVFVNNEEYGFGDFNRGEIEGFFLFRSRLKTFFAEFNLSRPINKMVLIDHESEKTAVVVHKTPIFEVISEKPTKNELEEDEIYQSINIKFSCKELVEFLEKQMCSGNSNFRIKSLHNGNTFFYFDHQSNPTSLGLCLNKNQQLVSYGAYVNDKLNGLGCKLQNTIKYEGLFENGFMNGIGLKYSQGKYSFGEFENGNLAEALFIDDRSSASEEKLHEFKRAEHLRSLWHLNAYVKKNIMKFKGIRDLIFEVSPQQQYLYPQTKPNAKKNVTAKNLALKMIKRDDFQTKSSKSFLVKPANRNPEDEDDGLSQSNNSYVGLSGLRKFKY